MDRSRRWATIFLLLSLGVLCVGVIRLGQWHATETSLREDVAWLQGFSMGMNYLTCVLREGHDRWPGTPTHLQALRQHREASPGPTCEALRQLLP